MGFSTPAEKVEEVRRLLRKRKKLRTVAKETSLSRGTITKICDWGDRPYEPRVNEVNPVLRVSRAIKFKQLPRAVECPSCGKKVNVWPCVACMARRKGI